MSSSRRKKRAPLRFLVRLNNLPQSHEYFINERGSLIHVRSYLPGDARSIRAVVFFSHGYGSHCNSQRKQEMGLALAARGVCMYQMDLEGHGYSDGVRAYIENSKHMVDDFMQLLELIAGERAQEIQDPRIVCEGVSPFYFAAPEEHRRRLREVPIFIAGESLGGALSIMLGLRLQDTKHPLLPRFKGEVLLAPAIKGNPPPPMIVMALRYLVAPLIPFSQIPSCLESVNQSDKCVLNEDERRQADFDHIGNPGGLGWGGNMRFGTGLALIDLTAEVSRRLEDVAFPFTIMHDPGDRIVQFNSSKELAIRARTPQEFSRGRELLPMDGWLHCLLTNCPDLIIGHVSDWILHHIELHEAREGPQLEGVLSRVVGGDLPEGACYASRGSDGHRLRGKKSLPPSFSEAEGTGGDERPEASLEAGGSKEGTMPDGAGGTGCESVDAQKVIEDLLIDSPSSSSTSLYTGTRTVPNLLPLTDEPMSGAGGISGVGNVALAMSAPMPASSQRLFPLAPGIGEHAGVSPFSDANSACVPRRRVASMTDLSM